MLDPHHLGYGETRRSPTIPYHFDISSIILGLFTLPKESP